MGLVPGLKAFVAAVIGGVGSIAGAMLGGYVLGMAEVLFVGLLPPEYSGYRNAFVFGTLILVLLLMAERPARAQHGDAGVSGARGARARLALIAAAGGAGLWRRAPTSIPTRSPILQFVGINVVLAVSLNITNGFVGLFSLGHPAFMTIGGYVTAILDHAVAAQGP